MITGRSSFSYRVGGWNPELFYGSGTGLGFFIYGLGARNWIGMDYLGWDGMGQYADWNAIGCNWEQQDYIRLVLILNFDGIKE